MSETITDIAGDARVGDIRISRDGDGYVELRQLTGFGTRKYDTIVIPTTQAQVAALALLGPGWDIVRKPTAESGKSDETDV